MSNLYSTVILKLPIPYKGKKDVKNRITTPSPLLTAQMNSPRNHFFYIFHSKYQRAGIQKKRCFCSQSVICLFACLLPVYQFLETTRSNISHVYRFEGALSHSHQKIDVKVHTKVQDLYLVQW